LHARLLLLLLLLLLQLPLPTMMTEMMTDALCAERYNAAPPPQSLFAQEPAVSGSKEQGDS